MFNIPDGRQTIIYMREFHRRMDALERVFTKDVSKIYKRQFSLAANMVEQGMTRDAEDAVDRTTGILKDSFRVNYRRIATVFSEWTLSEFAKVEAVKAIKTPKDEFWIGFEHFIETEVALKITQINNSQKMLIRELVRKGLKENLSHKDIAKEIRTKSEVVIKYKAKRIARTETHGVAVHSVQNQVSATGRYKYKQWSHSNDERVRSKRFDHRVTEIVKIDEDYQATGGSLAYPGDPGGAAGNVINCRCVEKYLKSNGE